MKSLAKRVSPFGSSALDSVFSDFDDMFLDFFRGRHTPGWMTKWLPQTDVVEGEKDYTVSVDLPGISQKDIEVEVKDGILTIKGERKHESEVKKENYHRVEKSYGEFSRSFSLPEHVDLDGIKAAYQDGVLSLTLPRRNVEKEPDVKKINVEAK